jgi:hypothetical protein
MGGKPQAHQDSGRFKHRDDRPDHHPEQCLPSVSTTNAAKSRIVSRKSSTSVTRVFSK